MRRREFLWILGGSTALCAIGCEPSSQPSSPGSEPDASAADPVPVDANSGVDVCAEATVLMHDTYAQALYLDGSNGPLTGTITVEYVIAGTAVTLDFWHGHGGVPHRFTVGPEHFAQLIAGERVTLGTTTVEDHAHTLFIDPLDEDYRVPDAPDVPVGLGHC